MKFLSVFMILYLDISHCDTFINAYPTIPEKGYESNFGKPLILTPLIRQGQIKQAQTAAEVTLEGFEGIKSYAAYLTVDDQFDSNMFFWFFPSQSDYAKDPVLLWLQGGPGVTSLLGLFMENGPFVITKEQVIQLRTIAWTQNHSVLYIDNPVGTGFSFTNANGYSQNQTAVGINVYNALLQFFQLFPELQKNKFFVTGESYAGKYVPAVSYTIYKNNAFAKQKINLEGLAIGNGLSDPEHQLKYGEYLYQLGLIDANAKRIVQQCEQQAIEYIKSKQWVKATKVFDYVFHDKSLFENITGLDNHYNYLVAKTAVDMFQFVGQFVNKIEVRRAIHVGNATFHANGQPVKLHLEADFMQSVAPWISELLNHYRVLIYNGQLDVVVAYPLTVNYLQNLNFSAADAYKMAIRRQWFVGDSLAGYVKTAGNLTEVMVRNAGHMVPTDQPLWAFDLISRFTRNKFFYN